VAPKSPCRLGVRILTPPPWDAAHAPSSSYAAAYRPQETDIGILTLLRLSVQSSSTVKVDNSKYVRRGPIRKALEKTLIFIVGRLGGRYRLFERRHPIELNRFKIPITDLPEAFEGFRIVQISDIHHGPYTLEKDLYRLVDLANAQKPDLVVLTGDFILNSTKYLPACIQALTTLRADQGIYAVLGNHDHREGAEQVREALEHAGIQVLRNRNVTLRRGEATLLLAGVADLEEDDPDLDLAFEGSEASQLRILLSHNPDIAEYMDGHQADLVIAGHTHGGQFLFPLIGAPFLPNLYAKYREGLRSEPAGKVFTTRGVGATLLPLRIACPPEMAVLTLVRNTP